MFPLYLLLFVATQLGGSLVETTARRLWRSETQNNVRNREVIRAASAALRGEALLLILENSTSVHKFLLPQFVFKSRMHMTANTRTCVRLSGGWLQAVDNNGATCNSARRVSIILDVCGGDGHQTIFTSIKRSNLWTWREVQPGVHKCIAQQYNLTGPRKPGEEDHGTVTRLHLQRHQQYTDKREEMPQGCAAERLLLGLTLRTTASRPRQRLIQRLQKHVHSLAFLHVSRPKLSLQGFC